MRQGRAHSVSKFVYPCESRDLQNGANNFQPAELWELNEVISVQQLVVSISTN